LRDEAAQSRLSSQLAGDWTVSRGTSVGDPVRTGPVIRTQRPDEEPLHLRLEVLPDGSGTLFEIES